MHIWIGVENFAKIERAKICTNNYTVLVGPNNSGKTFLMQLVQGINKKISYMLDETIFDSLLMNKGEAYKEYVLNCQNAEKLTEYINAKLALEKENIVKEIFGKEIPIGRLYIDILMEETVYNIALIDIDPQKSKEQLLVISNVVRESIKDVRRSLYKLRPGALDQRTLKDGLIKMIEEFQSVSHLNVDLYYEWENVDFENTKEDIIFRIIQETMTNALRHGHASHIEIHLFDEEEKYMIIMQDNGSGCKEIHYGYGLKQMHERVAILNGTIHFYSEEGFRTVVEIPKIGGKKDD